MKGDPEVHDIRALKYEPIHKIFFYKINFDNDDKELPNYCSCTKKVDTAKKLPCLYKSRLPLTLSKWKDQTKT